MITFLLSTVLKDYINNLKIDQFDTDINLLDKIGFWIASLVQTFFKVLA